MATAKLVKSDGLPPSDIEKKVADVLTDLQNSAEDIRNQLRELYIVGAKEVEAGNKSVILVYVPVPQLKQFNKIQSRLIRELEKKFGGKHVIFLARRRILPKPSKGANKKVLKQKRPYSRTLTAVHDAVLQELVYPAEVVGRRIRVKADGKRIHKVHLDKAQQTNVEHKIDAFAAVYKRLTSKDVVFEFPEPIF